ncbi:hypothetical protein BDFB_015073 [Asbolus verrucosus]
MKIIV